jgi:hypothetical protein
MRLLKSIALLSLVCLFVVISSRIRAQVGIGANIGPEPVRPYGYASEPLPAREELNSRFAAGLPILRPLIGQPPAREEVNSRFAAGLPILRPLIGQLPAREELNSRFAAGLPILRPLRFDARHNWHRVW